MVTRVQTMYDDHMEAEDDGFHTDALRSLLGALRSITDPTIESAKEASQFACDAAGQTASTREHAEQAIAEEEMFHRSVLDLLKTWTKPAIPLATFAKVGWNEDDGWPEGRWLQRYLNDESW